MKSLTKVELSAAQLEAAVHAAYGSEIGVRASQEFHDGWFNTIHGLELSNGRRVVLKTAPKPGVPVLRHETNLLETEVLVYRMLDDAGIPSPQVHYYEATGSILGLPFFFMDRIDLPTYAKVKEGLSSEERASIERSLGARNAQLNTISGPLFGSVSSRGFRSERWSEVFGHLFEQTLADGRDRSVSLPVPEEELRRTFLRLKPALETVTKPQLVHWDLHDANAFVDGGQVMAVIDADRSQWADPLMEIYFSSFFDQTHFVQGYGTDLRTLPGASARRALYDLHLGLIMVVEAVYRGFDQGHREWAAKNLVETMGRCQGIAFPR